MAIWTFWLHLKRSPPTRIKSWQHLAHKVRLLPSEMVLSVISATSSWLATNSISNPPSDPHFKHNSHLDFIEVIVERGPSEGMDRVKMIVPKSLQCRWEDLVFTVRTPFQMLACPHDALDTSSIYRLQTDPLIFLGGGVVSVPQFSQFKHEQTAVYLQCRHYSSHEYVSKSNPVVRPIITKVTDKIWTVKGSTTEFRRIP